MLTLESVAHCWNYERTLIFHLSAFCLYPPESCRLVATVFYAAEDSPVVRVLDWFRTQQPRNVAWNFRPLDPPQLCRRGIGRNMAARESTADYVLFSDVDYLFGDGALDTACAAMQAACADGPRLMWPRIVMSSISHAEGDSEIARANPDDPGLIAVDPSKYETASIALPIGGVQWLPGSIASEKGYLPEGHRHLRPAGEWRRTYCDLSARRYWGLQFCGLDVSGMWRMRHEKRGRFDVGCRN